jgi:hypothetical protein
MVAKDIPILHTGITDTATEYSTYPVKEHTKLLNFSGKPVSTPLNSMLAMRIIKIPTDRNDPNYKDRTVLETNVQKERFNSDIQRNAYRTCINGRVGRILPSPRTTGS